MPVENSARAIVGIGASAGGLEAFSQLLQNLPVDTGMAFVLVQHLDPRHQSILPELLSSRTRMPVVQVKEGANVRPNHVYVIPPNTTMAIHCGVLHLSPRSNAGDRHMPIDTFLASLARDQESNSIGVILSGAASDGTAGLRTIKAEGGITFAQDETAAFDGMPRSAVGAGIVDFVLPPERIAAELAVIASHPYNSTAGEEPAVADGPAMHRLLSMLRTSTGVDFSQYKPATVQRRVMRRAMLCKAEDVARYLEIVRQTPEEVQALFDDLLINVTEFFRDPAAFGALKEKAFPAFLLNRPAGQPVRIWVPACSTGEEVYSIAIALMEYMDTIGSGYPVQIFGTDVSPKAIDKARAGIYPDAVAASIRADRLRRFFVKIDSGYQIGRPIREMCIFSLHNVAKDPPLSRMDLISCRNLMIYLGPALQKRVMNVFLYSLQPNGCLLLGCSETPGPLSDFFVSVDRDNKIYVRRLTVTQPEFDLPSRMAAFPPFAAVPDPSGLELPKPADLPFPGSVQKYVDRMLLAQYAPSGLLVDKNFRIVEFRGEVGPYLGPAAGEAELDLFKMVREDLALHVRGALEEVRTKNIGIRLENIQIRDGSGIRGVTMAVSPISIPAVERHYLVLFEEVGRARMAATPAASRVDVGDSQAQDAPAQIAHLEEELGGTRRYLQTIIEELRSANEEGQSANEELQSTNEELQTAKEELQSSNEELSTLNGEMQSRNSELGVVNNDLLNLLSSMNVPIVMLSNDLRIRRFTPVSEKVLNLIASDVGRPISDLKPRIEVPDLEEMLHTVIETLMPYEREVQDRDGRWYSMRARPYRTAQNRIEGAVLQFLDIDQLKRSLELLRVARDYSQAIIDTVREPLAVLTMDLQVETANRSFYRIFAFSQDDVAGRSIFEIGGGLWDFPKVHALLDDVVSDGIPLQDIEIEHDFGREGPRTLVLNARRLAQHDCKDRILLAFEDITEQKKTAEARYRRLFESAKDGIFIVDAASGEITEINPFAEKLFGYSRADLAGAKLWEAGLMKGVPAAREAVADVLKKSVVRYPDLSLTTRGGGIVQVEVVANAYDEGGRKMIQFNVRDVTDRKRFERQLEHTQKLESLGLLSGGIAHDFNNLLTGVMGHASLALTEIERGERSHISMALREIVRASQRASDLTRQMLAYAGKGRIREEQIDLNLLIRDISVLIRSSLPRTVEIKLDLAHNLPAVHGDSGQIQQLIMNLVINGGEAVPAGKFGAVMVRTEARDFNAGQLGEYLGEGVAAGAYVVLEVNDTGAGMDEATKARIFDPFFTTKFTGRGLGLAAVLGIVRGHAGAIRIHTQPGRGTSFIVLLPARGPVPAPAPPLVGTESLTGSGTVLFVDDEEIVRRVAKTALGRNGYRVLLAEDGAQGVKIFREQHHEIAAVIVDKTMPVMGGEEAITEMRKIDAGVPLILSTGFSQDSESMEQLAGHNVAGFVQKPYRIETLLEAIKSAIANGERP